MPSGLDGFGVLQQLDERNLELPTVIFVTAYDRYAVRAFEAHALGRREGRLLEVLLLVARRLFVELRRVGRELDQILVQVDQRVVGVVLAAVVAPGARGGGAPRLTTTAKKTKRTTPSQGSGGS